MQKTHKTSHEKLVKFKDKTHKDLYFFHKCSISLTIENDFYFFVEENLNFL